MALLSIDTNGQLDPHLKEEWLLTNGLGGYSSSTVVGCNTRRYHGLLCAATNPPVGRVMALTRIAERIYLEDDAPDSPHELSVNQFRAGFHPHGWHYLRKFQLDQTARWEYEVEGIQIVKEVQLLWNRNVVGIRYTLESRRPRKLRFALAPFFSLRDFHGMRHSSDTNFEMSAKGRALKVTAYNHAAFLGGDAGSFQTHPDWWYNHYYAIENDRGSEDSEDLYSPGQFVLESESARASITVWASVDERTSFDWDEQLRLRSAGAAAARTAPAAANVTDRPTLAAASPSIAVARLVRAAGDFIVSRKMPAGGDGSTVIAGYPWFADWGRDTMISLPGLFLVTGRFEQAKQVLSVFAQYCSEGMIPNRFDDYTNEPSYNTVDASLWFIHAVFEYLRYTGDRVTFDALLRPACQSILDGYRKGTRFNIKMDEADGLISQGDAHTQLTWMDAKTNDVAFTPRQGKAVEINALWYHALKLMGDESLAEKVAASFKRAFWISPHQGLADVVDGSSSQNGYPYRDLSLRPNQIFAVSLANSPLSEDQRRAVVEVVQRELLTPMGLRTLARGDSRYCPRYSGDQYHRDACYHNGTVWAWPLGGFLSAFLRVNDRSAASIEHARGWLQPLIDQMLTNCIGQVAEIYEAEEPHRMVGCPAQAWSVAEVLRLAVELGM
ncbi:MAG TPA: amylo-alpha-1,6-glucosidase [Tepidisphaeraceae bacterium]|jgi:predicted glycogen debranching enzyme|nr:amylo-alpha-1,6-glucosidase [Tepidisphaeraceae bacterium]